MEFDEFLLNGAIESFGMGVHLWTLGISQPTNGTIVQNDPGELSLELRAVV